MKLCEISRAKPPLPKMVPRQLPEGFKTVQEFLQAKCPIAYNSEFEIYRGVSVKHPGEIIYANSLTAMRKSANTKNWYTLLMDNILPEWTAYPKRSQSFICSTSKRRANDFHRGKPDVHGKQSIGEVYRVYPIGNPNIGICPAMDLWFSFSNIGAKYIAPAFRELAGYAGLPNVDNLETLKQILDYYDSRWAKTATQNLVHNILWEFMDTEDVTFGNYTSLTNLLEYVLSPTYNGFELKKLSSLDNYSMVSREVWFSGPAYFVPINLPPSS